MTGSFPLAEVYGTEEEGGEGEVSVCGVWTLLSISLPDLKVWIALICAEVDGFDLGSLGFIMGWLGKVPFSLWFS